jgi:hypothetical protein
MFIILFPLGSTKKKNARSSLKSKSIALTYADFAKTNTEEGCLVEKTCLSVIDIIAFLYIVYIYMNTKDKERGGGGKVIISVSAFREKNITTRSLNYDLKCPKIKSFKKGLLFDRTLICFVSFIRSIALCSFPRLLSCIHSREWLIP